MKNDEVSRRSFLSKTMSVTAAVPFLALVGAAACDKGGDSGGGAASGGGETGGAEPAAPAAEPAGAICDVAKLPEAEKAKRQALGYIEKTADPEKNCANCNLYKEDNGAGCPGCTLFAGPVAPEGYCNSWVAKA